MMPTDTHTKSRKQQPQNDKDGLTMEAIHRQVADEAPVILWMTGADGHHHYFNSRWREFTGLDNTDDPEGKVWLDALHPDDRDQCVQQILAALSEHKPIKLTYRLRNRDGEYRWMLDRSRPCYADNGNFRGYVGAVVDISEQKKAETELESINHDLTRANKHAKLNREMNDHLQVCNNMEEVHAVLSYFVPQLFSRSSGAVYLINESRSLIEAVTRVG
ncbi:MAG: PAS domain S-box protein [Gammaproteobacteria bacterium]|nr:PAS domain S-box protein [Gammaproteobacteria bacterium]